MVLGPTVGYMSQYRKIYSSKSADGFSIFVSFILIVANVLRIFWRVVADFSEIIFGAAILMLIT
jgi:hypothetical protein